VSAHEMFPCAERYVRYRKTKYNKNANYSKQIATSLISPSYDTIYDFLLVDHLK